MNLSKLIVLFHSAFLIYGSNVYAEKPLSERISNWKKNDGYLIISVPTKLERFDPVFPIKAHTKFTLPLIYESLITLNAEQELQPVLAKHWSILANGKSILITINPNHHFSDNTEVTAEDVVKSINYLCRTGSKGFSEMKGLIGCEEQAKGKSKKPEIYAINKYELKLNIKTNPTTFLYQLSSPTTVITKVNHGGLIGSGPYKVAKKENDYAILTKNIFYSGDIDVKNPGVILFYANGPSLPSTLIKDKIDGALMYRMEDLFNFTDKNYKLIKSNPNITKILVLNNQKFPFKKLFVRKALATEIFNNFDYTCIPGSHKPYGIIPTGIGGSITNIQPLSLPPINYKNLITRVPELKNRKAVVTVHQLYDVANECESKQIIKAAKKFNIDLKFKYHKDYSEVMSPYLNHKLDAYMDLYIFKNREAYRILEFFTKNGENHANVSNSDIDELLEEAIKASTSHARFQMYRKIAQLIQDDHIVIPIFYMDHANLMSKCLSGISLDFFFNPFSELPKISKQENCENRL